MQGHGRGMQASRPAADCGRRSCALGAAPVIRFGRVQVLRALVPSGRWRYSGLRDVAAASACNVAHCQVSSSHLLAAFAVRGASCVLLRTSWRRGRCTSLHSVHARRFGMSSLGGHTCESPKARVSDRPFPSPAVNSCTTRFLLAPARSRLRARDCERRARHVPAHASRRGSGLCAQ